jgi:hypothetical protein
MNFTKKCPSSSIQLTPEATNWKYSYFNTITDSMSIITNHHFPQILCAFLVFHITAVFLVHHNPLDLTADDTT